MSHQSITQIQINKSDLSQLKTCELDVDLATLGKDQVLLKIDSFGFSANNITYAVFGETMGYWGFFPAQQGYGIVPLWGFATVVHSNHPDIKNGEKVYGYLPMATHLVITAGQVNAHGFYDVDTQRKSISPVYDQYVRCATDPGYQVDKEVWQLNYRPLFMTSFVLDDYTGEQISDQVKTVIVTSASSKTAYGAAYLLKLHEASRKQNYKVVGLTSKSNMDFTKQTGCYDQVLSYEDYALLDADDKSCLLDFAGNKPLLLNVKSHLGANLEKLIFIGATDVKAQVNKVEGDLGGELFFAPSQIKKRYAEWGAQDFLKKYAVSWHQFSTHIESLISTREVNGVGGIISLYLEGLNGNFKTTEMNLVKFD